MSDFTTVDFHYHIRPKEAFSESFKPIYAQVEDPVADSFRNMKESGTDTEVISSPTDFPPNVAERVSKTVNDAFSKIIKTHPENFAGLARLPLADVPKAVEELDRAINDLELNGVLIKANVDGVPLDDPRFSPLFEKCNDMELAVLVHPGLPPWGDAGMKEYELGPLLGYMFDTVLAATRMMYSGVFDEYPKIKFAFAHLGAGLPFLVHRISAPYSRAVNGKPSRSVKGKREPIEYLKMAYFDTATIDVGTSKYALKCTLDAVGADRMLFGTDYPWQNSETIRRMRQLILDMDISDEDKKKILGGNARKILRLD